jgi:uncharacterized protein (DUF433 family)
MREIAEDQPMISIPAVIDVPLHTDENGVIRIGQTRVTLTTIIACHQQGESPEDIQRGFPTVALVDIYAVIAYYLAHREAVDAYIRQYNQDGEAIRRKWEALPSYKPLTREMLLARLEQKKRDQK